MAFGAIITGMKTLRLVLLLSTVSLLGACNLNPEQPAFVNMSDEELYAYNLEKPLKDQVYCRTETTTSTYIRKRRCNTVLAWVQEIENNAASLQVLNFGWNYNQGIGRSRD